MEGNKKFLKKRNRDSSKNRTKGFKNSFSKKRDFSQKKKGFGITFRSRDKQPFKKFNKRTFNKSFNNNYDYDNTERYSQKTFQSNKKSEVLKIAKYWEQKQIIDPINTQGKIAIDEANNQLFSIVGNELKILDCNNLSTIKAIQQVKKLFLLINLLSLAS